MKLLKTKQDFVRILRECQISAGDCVLVHDSDVFKSLIGQSVVVVDAFKEVLGQDGTLVVYHVNEDIQDPGYDEAVSFWARQSIRQYLSQLTEKDLLYGQNPLFQTVCNQGLVYVSHHPRVKVAAIGKFAKYITRETDIDFPFGNKSPFQALLDVNAKIFMADQQFAGCLELKLGCSAQSDSIIVNGYPQNQEWHNYLDYEVDTHLFELAFNQVACKKYQNFLATSYMEVLAVYKANKKDLFKVR